MSEVPASYSVVTPARNEAADLPRLTESLARQTLLPSSWVIVDDSSTDDTVVVASSIVDQLPWARLLCLDSQATTQRGGKVVRAFQAGLDKLEVETSIVVKVDADVSFPPHYFEHLVSAFSSDAGLGMASGRGLELQKGVWRPRHMTAGSLWGAARAYRWECLQQVLPLEERMGWDGIDALKANLAGWQTRIVPELTFYHHRVEGVRDGSRVRPWFTQGRGAYYMRYRPSYLVLRSLNYARRDPPAVFMGLGYVFAALRRDERSRDMHMTEELRRRQRLRDVPLRALEALGRRMS